MKAHSHPVTRGRPVSHVGRDAKYLLHIDRYALSSRIVPVRRPAAVIPAASRLPRPQAAKLSFRVRTHSIAEAYLSIEPSFVLSFFDMAAVDAKIPGAKFFFEGESGRNTRGLLRLIILCTIAAAAVASRLFSVIRFESIIHECMTNTMELAWAIQD